MGNNLRRDIAPWVIENLNAPFLQQTDALGKGWMTGQGRLEAGGRNDRNIFSKIFTEDTGGERVSDTQSPFIDRIECGSDNGTR